MHAALHDHLGGGGGRELGELQTVADIIGDAVINFRRLIVVRQDHRVALALQFVDRLDVRRVEGPFDRRHDLRDALVKMRGRGLDLRRPIEIGPRQNRKALAKGNAERRDAGALAGFADK